MTKKIAYSILIASTLITGCSGLKFKDEAINTKLPNDWRFRTSINNTADLRFFMKENVGLLITPDNTPGKYRILSKPIIADGFTAREEIIKDGVVYSSKITQEASAQGGYLTFAADLSANQAYDYRIVDISRVDIPWPQIPDAKIRAAAATPNPSGLKRLWIQSLTLSRVLKQSYSELKCNASGSGPAFQTGGKCFNSSGEESNDYAIGAVLVDIDDYVKDYPGATPTPSLTALTNRLNYFSSLKAKIQKKDTYSENPAFIRTLPEISMIEGIIKD